MYKSLKQQLLGFLEDIYAWYMNNKYIGYGNHTFI